MRRHYDHARVRPALVLIPVAASLALAACGTESIAVPEGDPTHEGAVLFAERCSGCHTIAAAGTQGSQNRNLRNQGPDFDQREVSYYDALFAIRNGGFSGAIMPQNIVVGDDAKAVARFIAQWSGSEVEEPPQPGGGQGAGQAEGQ
jgi:mono/diheme cytochrome c family protein